MANQDSALIVSNDIFYKSVLEEIKKSKDRLQPIYEAFTNSLESIKQACQDLSEGKVVLRLYTTQATTDQDTNLDRIEIEDNGVGFNEENFDRLKRLKDNRKGFCNKGSGRIQLLHFFDSSEYVSVYQCNGKFEERRFTLSKKWVLNNSIISHSPPEPSSASVSKTVLTLRNLLERKDVATYDKLTATLLKNKLIERYLLEFCTHRNDLPQIIIEEYADEVLAGTQIIGSADIPKPDQESILEIRYNKLTDDGDFVSTARSEKITMTCFKVGSDSLEWNGIKLTCKGEIINHPKIQLSILKETDAPDGNRFLFLLSGDYLNNRDSDTRGALKIATKETFYGYLVGEKFNVADIRSADSDFQQAYHLGYLFRPSKKVVGEANRRDGSLYTEVLQYSDLLKRAKKRNEIFIKKLTADQNALSRRG